MCQARILAPLLTPLKGVDMRSSKDTLRTRRANWIAAVELVE